MPAATDALMLRVDPNCAIDTTRTAGLEIRSSRRGTSELGSPLAFQTHLQRYAGLYVAITPSASLGRAKTTKRFDAPVKIVTWRLLQFQIAIQRRD
jgi:hypothetical protein